MGFRTHQNGDLQLEVATAASSSLCQSYRMRLGEDDVGGPQIADAVRNLGRDSAGVYRHCPSIDRTVWNRVFWE